MYAWPDHTETGGRMPQKCANTEEPSSVLYESFRRWAHENGEYVVNNRKFKQKLLEKDIQLSRTSKGSMYSGLRLQEGLTDF